MGKPSPKEIIASHGGIVNDKVRGRTNILVIGDRPGKVKVRDAKKRAVQIVHIYTLERFLGGTMTFKELIETPSPKITEYSAGYPWKLPPETQATKPSGGMQLNLPHAVPTDSITDGIASAESNSSVQLISPPWQHGIKTIPATAKEQKRSVVFNNTIFKRKNDLASPSATSTASQAQNFVEGTVVTPSAGTRSTGSKGRRPPKLPKWTTVVTIEIRCVGEGDIQVMVPDLLFKGLKTLEDEYKDVCFLNPDNYAEQARKRNDVPVKFQRIYETWSAFEEPLAKI